MNNLHESREEPIPGYRLIERLGRGGYGDVWKVEAPGGFHKAMKFVFGVLGDEAEAAADQEFAALRKLVQIRHPFILSVERCDVVDGQVLITMELADRSLEDRFHECKSEGLPGVPRGELLLYMTEAAEALDLLSQEYRLQHLDIKPTNLFLVRKHVKVGDFGLVRQLDDFEAPIRSGLTPLYAPPESYEGTISLNSDQYSLALVYHEMLTGVRAIDGECGRELMFRTLVSGPVLSAVPEPERAVLAKALAKQPRERFASCQEFVEALRNSGLAGTSVFEIEMDDEAVRSEFDLQADRSASRKDRIPDEGASRRDKPSHGAAVRAKTRRHRKFNIAELATGERPSTYADGTLQPTFVIGLGGFGVRMGERVRGVLQEQFGEAASKLPIHVLYLDVDPDALRQAAKLDGAVPGDPHLLICRLQKAAEYRANWDSSKHLSSWLDSDQVFRISSSGETQGHRSLGRLAVVDSLGRVAQQILASLGTLLSKETGDEVFNATGLRYRRVEPRVFITAGMGGGVGGGMALDVAYLVTGILKQAGINRPDVRLALAAGIHPARDRELQIASQFSFANDLAAFWAGEVEYARPAFIDGLPESIKARRRPWH